MGCCGGASKGLPRCIRQCLANPSRLKEWKDGTAGKQSYFIIDCHQSLALTYFFAQQHHSKNWGEIGLTPGQNRLDKTIREMRGRARKNYVRGRLPAIRDNLS